jgi:hypothetical protein
MFHLSRKLPSYKAVYLTNDEDPLPAELAALLEETGCRVDWEIQMPPHIPSHGFLAPALDTLYAEGGHAVIYTASDRWEIQPTSQLKPPGTSGMAPNMGAWWYRRRGSDDDWTRWDGTRVALLKHLKQADQGDQDE